MIGHASPVICSGIWPNRRDHRPRPEPSLPEAWAAALGAERQRRRHDSRRDHPGTCPLGILHQTTLPYSPYQNAKQEAFWGPVEGRLMAMFKGVADLTLAMLNEATQAWAEFDHNRKSTPRSAKPRSRASSADPM